MRRLFVSLIILVVLVLAAVMGLGWWARSVAEDSLARHIEAELPGTTATVGIESFPFLVRLAASGTVEELSVHLDHLSAGPLDFNGVKVPSVEFSDIEVRVQDIRVSRGELMHGQVAVEGIRRAVVTATVSQAALDQSLGVPVDLGRGSVGIGGLRVPAKVAVYGRDVSITVPGRITVTLAAPSLAVMPCIGGVVIAPGELRLSCTLHSMPPIFSPRSFAL